MLKENLKDHGAKRRKKLTNTANVIKVDRGREIKKKKNLKIGTANFIMTLKPRGYVTDKEQIKIGISSFIKVDTKKEF